MEADLPLDAMLQFSFEFITVLLPDGKIAYQSPSSELYLGYSPDEMIGTGIGDYIESCEYGCDPGAWESALAQACGPLHFEAIFRHAQGFPVFVECYTYLDTSQPERRLILHGRDVGEVKTLGSLLRERDHELARSDAELKALIIQHVSELEAGKRRVESILNNSSDAIILATPEGRICQTNASFDQLFGYLPDQMYDQPLILTIVPEQWRAFSSALRAATERGQRSRLDVQACRINGDNFDADVAIAPLPHDPDAGIVVSLRDISERKQMENALRENERRFRGLFESSNDAVFIISLDHIILAANPRAVDLLGYPIEEIVGSPARRFTITEEGESEERLLALQLSGTVPIYERRFRRANGEIRHTEINIAIISDAGGTPLHIQSIVHDITARKLIENELRQSLAREQELGILRARFVSIVSHEFRTPLATIQTTSDALRYYWDKMNPEQIEGRFNKIEAQIKHMVMLLEDVLTFGQVQSNTLTAKRTPINLDEFCQVVLDDLRGINAASAVMYECSDPAVEVLADKKLLRQIITNLVTNARKYSPNGSPVHVRLSQTGTAAVIEFADQGIGIPEEDQTHLFEAFHRASNTGHISGTGLGLAITKHAVELHNGTIAVKSAVGVGSTFTITLPIKTIQGIDP